MWNIYIVYIYIHIMFGLSTMQSAVIRHLPSGEDFESVVLWFFRTLWRSKNAFCVWKKLGLQSKYCTKLCCIEKLLPTQQTPTRSNCVSRMEIGLSPHIFQVSSRFRSLVFWCYNVGPPNVINWFITTMNYINPVTIYELFKRIINHTEFLEWFGPRTCKVVPPKWCERWFICHGN